MVFTLQSVSTTPQNEGLLIDFNPVKVPSSLSTPTLVAMVTFYRKPCSVVVYLSVYLFNLFLKRFVFQLTEILFVVAASRVANLRTMSGRITLKSKTGQFKASIGYQITVPGSYLHYNASSTKFLADDHRELPSCQQLGVSNDFALPIDILEATLVTQVSACLHRYAVLARTVGTIGLFS